MNKSVILPACFLTSLLATVVAAYDPTTVVEVSLSTCADDDWDDEGKVPANTCSTDPDDRNVEGSRSVQNNDLMAPPQGEVRVLGSLAGRGTVNPDRGETVKIVFSGNAPGRYELRIFALTGELAWEAAQDNVSEGTFEWGARDIASGIYIAHVKGPGINTKKRVAIVR